VDVIQLLRAQQLCGSKQQKSMIRKKELVGG
jgi:hypothetical protein